MNAVFGPAITLMNRLRITQKFAAIALLVLVVLSVLVVQIFVALREEVRVAQQQLDGIEVVAPFTGLVRNLQQHRGLSAGVLSGNPDLQAARSAKEKEVAAALQDLAGRLPALLRDGRDWQAIVRGWRELERDGLGLTAVSNMRQHTALVEEALLFELALADHFDLILASRLEAFYLTDTTVSKLPTVLERLARMRGMGTGFLSKKAMHDQERADLGRAVAEMESALRLALLNIDKLTAQNAHLAGDAGTRARAMAGAAEALVRVVNGDILQGAFASSPKDYYEQATRVIDQGYGLLQETMLPGLRLLSAQRLAEAQRKMRLTGAAVGLMLLVSGYLAVAAYLSIVGGLRTLGATAERLAQGDLRARVDLRSRDELRELGEHFNRMVDDFSRALQNIKAGARDVLAGSRRLAESASQIAIASQEQSASAASMAASVEQMTVGVDQISQHAIDAQGVTRQSAELSAGGGRLVEAVVEEMGRIAESVNASATVIGELGQQSATISTIVGVIREIADQTNLLALNAAIEAARAGEAGRGFAVVADEVRKLAERTAGSTREIAAMVTQIQGGTQMAVDSMQAGVERVGKGVALSREAGGAMAQVEAGARQVSTIVNDVSLALREQSAASAELARNVERIAQMAEESSAAVAENATTAVDLQRLAEALRAEADHFEVA